jgi:hypothetical protein
MEDWEATAESAGARRCRAVILMLFGPFAYAWID